MAQRAIFLFLIFAVCIPVAHAQVNFIGAQSTVPATGLAQPSGAILDPGGNLYIADTGNNRIVKVDPRENQTVVSVSPLTVSAPLAVAFDSSGNLFVSDNGNNRIVKIPPGGGAATSFATVVTPGGIAVDASGNVFVTDNEDAQIVKITSAGVSSSFESDLSDPVAVAVDAAGNVYLADGSLNSISKYPPAGGAGTNVGSSLFDISGVAVDGAGNVYVSESGEGTAIIEITPSSAQITLATTGLGLVNFLTVDSNYDVFLPDASNNDMIEFSTISVPFGFLNVCQSGAPTPCSQTATLQFTLGEDSVSNVSVVTTGDAGLDFSQSAATCSGETSPCTVQVTFQPTAPGMRSGAVIITDSALNQPFSFPLYGNGLAANAGFSPALTSPPFGTDGFEDPFAVAVAGAGVFSGGPIFIADDEACRIWILAEGEDFTPYAGDGTCGYSGDGAAATSAELNAPEDVALDGAGNLYIADEQNSLVRKVDRNGIITTVAGNVEGGFGFSGDGGPATSAQLHHENGIAFDTAGNLYIADAGNNRVRKVDLAGIITTVAGNGTPGFAGDGGPAISAELHLPFGVRVDTAGNLYIADALNNVIRKVDVNGIITTVAGNFELGGGYSGDGGPATSAQLQFPAYVSVDAAGQLFISDNENGVIRFVDGNGKISTYPLQAQFPADLVVDPTGNLAYIDPEAEALTLIVRTIPNTLDFGNQNVNTSSAPQDVTVTNIGNEPLNFSLITPPTGFNLNGPDTSCSVETPLDLGISCILGIEFEPATAGNFDDTVVLTDNNLGPAAMGNQPIEVTGTGVIPVTATTTALTVAPNPVTFGATVTLTATISPTPTGSSLGTVSFFNGSTQIGSAATVNSSGVATVTSTTLPVGTDSITAVYSGTSTFGTSTSTATNLVVNQVTTGTVLTGATSPSTYGSSVTLTATISPAPTGSSLGTVTFLNGSSSVGTGNVNSSGVATLILTNLPVGSLSLTATYNGNTNFATSTSSAIIFIINQATTTTALTLAPNPVSTGQTETLTATITPAPTGSSLGTVSFFNGSTQIGSAATVNSSGVATLTSTTLPASILSITAVYSGNTNFAGSTSTAQSLTVLQATTTALVAAPSPATFGATVTLTATVSPAPTGSSLGTVSFFSGATQIGSAATVNSSGVATVTTATLPVGTASLTAVYSGNAAFATSTSSAVSLTVNTAPTTTTFTAAPNPSAFGATITFTATIAPVPTGSSLGTVSFFDGATLIGSAATVNSSGVATITSNTLTVGTHSVTAVYSGNTNFAGSTSSATNVVVNQTVTTTALTLGPNPVKTGQTETLTATITPTPIGSSLGTVSFFNGATQIGTAATVNSSGVATLTSTTLPAGVLSITAVYSGNTNFATSTSTAQSLTVLQATTTALAAAPSPATFGATVTLTATVSPAPTGSSLGTVSFFNGSTQIGTAATVNSSGVVTTTTSTLPVGIASLTAVYSGNAAFATSTSSAVSLTVNTAPTTTTFTAAPNPATFGATITFTATVAPVPTGSSLGTVSFFDGSTLIGSAAAVNSSGVATITSNTLAVGTHSVTAAYSGNTNFAGSTSSATNVVVNQVTTATALAAAPNPVVAGSSVTLTATVTPAPTGSSLGTVSFFNGATQIGSAATVNSSGVATLATTTLPTGVLSLTAVYSGNTNYAGSTSSAQSLTVLIVTTTALNGSPNPATFGATVTLTATVSPAPAGSTLGTVSFFNGSTQIGAAVAINSSGVATTTTSTLPVGTLSLTAVYSGNSTSNTSTSSALSFTVNPAPTTTVLGGSPSPATFGQSVTLTATISPIPTGSTLGTVTFFNGATQLGTGNVSSTGTATFTSTTLPAGTLSLTAVYSGNAGYTSSTSAVFSLVVNTTFTVTAPATPFTVGEGGSVQITVSVPPLGGAYNNVVTMTATGLPAGSTGTFLPTTVTPGASGMPTTFTIQLAPLAAGMQTPAPKGPMPLTRLLASVSVPAYLSLLTTLLATLFLFFAPRRDSFVKAARVAAMIAVAGLIGTALAGCSGGFLRPPSTQPGQFKITVTGTSGSTTQTATVTVIVTE